MKTFYVNGTILTMEEDALYAEAVCVEEIHDIADWLMQEP